MLKVARGASMDSDGNGRTYPTALEMVGCNSWCFFLHLTSGVEREGDSLGIKVCRANSVRVNILPRKNRQNMLANALLHHS